MILTEPGRTIAAILLCSLLISACSSDSSGDSNEEVSVRESVFGNCGSGAPIELPCGYPMPRETENNPLTLEKIELGRLLFYDRNMSFNQTQSCGDCHLSEKAFTDGLAVSIGSEGHTHPRNAMSMTNVVYNSTMNWANNQMVNLTQQALAVITNEDPIELGWSGRETTMLSRLVSPDPADYTGTPFAITAPDYPGLFAKAFPDEAEQITMSTFSRAVAAFSATFISGDSDFDKENRGEANGMTDAAKRGRELFFGERMECFHCHSGFNFTDSVDHSGVQFTQNSFHNNALYNLDGNGLYPSDNHGLREFTLKPEDEGKFRAPTLRNIELTAPYMHDGSIASLEEVIDHYARGGRLISVGPNAGDGALSPLKSSFVTGFVISPEERLDLVAFLHSLTDWQFICRDDLTDPFGNLNKHPLCP